MDEQVVRAMAKWPDVPDVYGWLSLDRRGRWRLKGEALSHRATIDFIHRNYGPDSRGSWFFQNGPQRVFVALNYTPYIFRTCTAGGLASHTGQKAGALLSVWLDEAGALILATELGVGLLDDRDLPEIFHRLVDTGDEAAEDWPGATAGFLWQGRRLPLQRVHSAELPPRFGFIQNPAPPP